MIAGGRGAHEVDVGMGGSWEDVSGRVAACFSTCMIFPTGFETFVVFVPTGGNEIISG